MVTRRWFSGKGWTSSRTSLLLMVALLVLILALPASGQEAVQFRTTHNLHLRAAPSTAARIYATMPHDTVLTATAFSFNYRWLRVSYNGQEGWASRVYLEYVGGDLGTLPLSDEQVPPALVRGYIPAGQVIVSPVRGVNIRMEPDPEADLITVFRAGEQASARAVTPGELYVFVQYGAFRGWVAGRYLDVVAGEMADLPVVAPGEVFIDFSTDRTFIAPGQCAQISWTVAGARGVFYGARTVSPQGTRRECPAVSTRYTLRVVGHDGQVFSREIDVIIGVADVTFTVDQESIQPGQCATLEWRVTGVQQVFIQGEAVEGEGFRQVCPTETTTYNLHAVTADGSAIDREVTVTIGATPVPGGGGLSIVFNADRTFISAGECAVLNWQVSGAVSVTYQSAPVGFSGSRQECPTTSTTYVLRVTTASNTVDTRFVTVNVSG